MIAMNIFTLDFRFHLLLSSGVYGLRLFADNVVTTI